jgi:two-component system, OmpR family, phosphate regulon sensor histidine kinase PhoR
MQRKIKLVLGLIICFLIVINGLQVTWIYNAYKQEKEQYGRVLTQSLGEAVMNYTYQQMQKSDNNSSTLFIISSPGLMHYNVTAEPGKEKMSFNSEKLFIDSIKSGLGHSQLLQIQNRKEFGITVFDSLFKNNLRKSDIAADYILDTIRIANSLPGKTSSKIQPLVPTKAFYPIEHPGFPVKTAVMLANIYGDLYVYASFRSYSPFLYKKNILFIVTSLAILIIVNTVLLFVLKTIRRQKKINEIKNDFINNMTHELRTPITVSASAIDSILHHHGLDNKEKVREYLELSKAELLHLDHLVEKILNMSIEDPGNLGLSYEKVNVSHCK